MKNSVKKLLLEMTLIVFFAAAAGAVWNHGMLRDAWTGTIAAAPSPPSVSSDAGGMPLPAGLMQVKEMFDRKEAVFVDARDELSFARGHIKGAISLPLGQFEAKAAGFTEKVPLSAAIAVYCNGYGCHDSMTLGTKLMSRGYRQVFVFEGGYPEWKDGKLPVEGQNP